MLTIIMLDPVFIKVGWWHGGARGYDHGRGDFIGSSFVANKIRNCLSSEESEGIRSARMRNSPGQGG